MRFPDGHNRFSWLSSLSICLMLGVGQAVGDPGLGVIKAPTIDTVYGGRYKSQTRDHGCGSDGG